MKMSGRCVNMTDCTSVDIMVKTWQCGWRGEKGRVSGYEGEEKHG